MEIDMNKENWSNGPCPKYDCRKNSCKCGLKFVSIPAALGDDSKDSPVAPKNGAYCNAIVMYEANNHVYIYSKEGIPTLVEASGDVEKIIEQLEDQLDQEILDRQAADNTLQGEIDDLKNSPDVVDIVQDYAELQAYDTSSLGDNDIIRVLEDETHDGNSTYYRWNSQTETWTYVGEIDLSSAIFFYADPAETGDTRHIYKDEGLTEAATIQDVLDAEVKGQVILRKITNSSVPRRLRYEDAYFTRINIADPTRPDPKCWLYFLGYDAYHDYVGHSLSDSNFTYTKHEFQGKLTAGDNITINNNTISATNTTYSDFTGTDGQTAGAAGLVPAPATTDAGKFLKADGTWDTAGGGGPTVVQTTGTSITDVMSQKAVTDELYPQYSSKSKGVLAIGDYSNIANYGSNKVGIGKVDLGASSAYALAINGGDSVGTVDATSAIGIWSGSGGSATGHSSIAIGPSASVSGKGAVAIGRNSSATSQGEFSIGTTDSDYGYNNTNYRLLSGVHDPVNAHDAATKGYVDANAGGVKTLTSADYNFPSNNPFVLAPWLLPPGQYIVAPHTDVMPDGNSQTYDSSTPYGILVFTQAMSSGGDYGTFIISGNNLNGYYKVQYNGTAVTGFPHEI